MVQQRCCLALHSSRPLLRELPVLPVLHLCSAMQIKLSGAGKGLRDTAFPGGPSCYPGQSFAGEKSQSSGAQARTRSSWKSPQRGPRAAFILLGRKSRHTERSSSPRAHGFFFSLTRCQRQQDQPPSMVRASGQDPGQRGGRMVGRQGAALASTSHQTPTTG